MKIDRQQTKSTEKLQIPGKNAERTFSAQIHENQKNLGCYLRSDIFCEFARGCWENENESCGYTFEK